MPGVSPIRTTFFTLWCWVSWLLNGLAWRMTWSCHSQVRHRLGRGSDAVRMAGSSTDTLSPTEVGALSMAVHPAIASCLSLCLASAGGQAWSLQLVLWTDTLSPAEAGSLSSVGPVHQAVVIMFLPLPISSDLPRCWWVCQHRVSSHSLTHLTFACLLTLRKYPRFTSAALLDISMRETS